MLTPESIARFIEPLAGKSLVETLRSEGEAFTRAILGLSVERLAFAYAPGKWTAAQLIGHVIDSERIFPYRALRIARMDPGVLSSFEEDVFAAHAGSAGRTSIDLAADFSAARASSVALFASFTPEMLARIGEVGSYRIDVEGIGFQMLGHQMHHARVLAERYRG